MSSSSSTIVPIRMRENTINQVDKLKNCVKAPSRSDAIRRAVEIADTLISAVISGDRILIEDKKGKQIQILIAGLKN